jgi:hypothetical protein
MSYWNRDEEDVMGEIFVYGIQNINTIHKANDILTILASQSVDNIYTKSAALKHWISFTKNVIADFKNKSNSDFDKNIIRNLGEAGVTKLAKEFQRFYEGQNLEAAIKITKQHRTAMSKELRSKSKTKRK